jgi:hypothetical protein
LLVAKLNKCEMAGSRRTRHFFVARITTVAQALVIRANSEPLRLANVPARLCGLLGRSLGAARSAHRFIAAQGEWS